MASNDEQRSATTILTTAAQSIATRLIANETTAKFTKAEISTTNLFNQSVTELQVLTSLDNVQQTADINTVTVINNNTVNVNVAIDQTKAPNNYQMNSVGLFAVDGDGKEVLYSVTVLKDPVYIHQDAMGSALGIDLETVVGQASNVEISVNPAGAVTNEILKAALADYVKTDDSTVVHTADMRKPASDVAGIEEVNTKQDKIGYTPADDSKVVHDNHDGTVQINGHNINPFDTVQKGYQPYGLDFDNYINSGNYRFDNVTTINYPSMSTFPNYWQLIVLGDGNSVYQIANGHGITAMRQFYAGSGWASWIQVADDSKVVHTADTSSWQKQKITNDDGSTIKTLSNPSSDNLNTYLNSLSMGVKTIVCIAGVPGNPSATTVKGIFQVTSYDTSNKWNFGSGYLIDSNNNIWSVVTNAGIVTYALLASDSKVAHLSGANNFDTVPTVNNNPLLLASSLPSDLARTGQDANFTGKLQQNGQDVALANNTIARNPNTGVVSEPVDFTKLTVNGGKSVATSDDLKSLEASAWRPLTLANSTSGTILFKDNGDGTASLIGSATFTIAKGTKTLTPVITPPTGYTFTSLKWSKGTNNKGVYVTGNMTGVSFGTSYIFDTSLSNGDICFLGSSDDIYTVTFSPSELTTLSDSIECNPALVSISKV